MKILILPGSSTRNKDWAFELEDNIPMPDARTDIQGYDSWKLGKDEVDFAHELAELDSIDLSTYDLVLAKSIGSILLLTGFSHSMPQPARCILMGLPLAYINENNVDIYKLLNAVKVPTTIIQNSDDPVGSFNEIEGLDMPGNITVVEQSEVEPSSHKYINYDLINRLIQD